ncbi:LppU family putative lipoprotein [Mycobacterium riyadhense]|uniref:Lipoprotein LppU n=1 Tax=Mycobacterium riyadhense TaxID=486698 RepID=A0A1X2DG23_9MYCO|nr:hypothetical protein [Mycobacterium riyadhense]MCV7146467.1 hypothetical protein [Mycobacterium riyadhense]ORW87088.1 hypothetical protein AWC22_08910 [Mycobacterium riyadhense]VTO94853.1 hypothetical protein BIN_B_00327 [Mycobacterium riyadhense]
MRALLLAMVMAFVGLTGCSTATNSTNVVDFKVGECLKLGGTPDRPKATKATCGSRASNFKVVAAFQGTGDRAQCPTDVDSSYSMHNAVSGVNNTVCLDIDWVIGGCMSVDPHHTTDPFRVDCNDGSVPHRQRATQILTDLDPPVTVDQCASGLGYTYTQRRFVVCVENVSG